MAQWQGKLKYWEQEGLVTAKTVQRISDYEKHRAKHPVVVQGLALLGGFSIVIGLLSMIAANWHTIPAGVKLAGHFGLTMALSGLLYQSARKGRALIRETVALIWFGTNLTFLALIGQIYQVEADWGRALLIWLAVSTPVLWMVCKRKFVPALWFVALVVMFYIFFELLQKSLLYFSCLMFLLYGIGRVLSVPSFVPNFTAVLQQESSRLLAIVLSVGLLMPGELTDKLFPNHPNSTILALCCMAAATFSIFCIWRKEKTFNAPLIFILSAHLLLSFVLGIESFLPMLDSRIGRAVFFILYWMTLGYAGVRMENKQLSSLAMSLICLRILIFYFELFQDLMSTGILLMGAGGTFIGLAVLFFKVQRFMSHKATSQPGKA